MKTYNRISLGIGIVLMAVWAYLYAGIAPPAAHDGQAPAEAGLLLFFSTILLGAVLLHDTVVALVLALSKKPDGRAREGKLGVALCVAMWVVYVAYLFA